MFNPDGKWFPHKLTNEQSDNNSQESMDIEENTKSSKNKTFSIKQAVIRYQ